MGVFQSRPPALLILLVLLLTSSLFAVTTDVRAIEVVETSVTSQDTEWLVGWQYRKQHTILGAVGAGTDYQIRITVHRTSGPDTGEHVFIGTNCEPDFADIRFTDDDGSTILDYWLASYDFDIAVFWVEVIDNLDSSQSIFIYYGNSTADSISNGDATFPLFDDFNRPNSDNIGGDWFDDSGDGDNDIESNLLKTVQNENQYCHIEKSAPSLTTFALHGKLSQHSMAPASWRMAIGVYWGSGTWAKIGWRSNDNFEAHLYTASQGEDNGALHYSNLDGTWCHYKIEFATSSVDFYYSLDGASWILVHSATRFSTVSTAPSLVIVGKGYENVNSVPGYLNGDWDNNYATAGPEYTNYADDIFVRRFVDYEPVQTSWGSEQDYSLLTTTTTDTISPPISTTPQGMDIPLTVILGIGGGAAAVVIVVLFIRKGSAKGPNPTSYDW